MPPAAAAKEAEKDAQKAEKDAEDRGAALQARTDELTEQVALAHLRQASADDQAGHPADAMVGYWRAFERSPRTSCTSSPSARRTRRRCRSSTPATGRPAWPGRSAARRTPAGLLPIRQFDERIGLTAGFAAARHAPRLAA